MISLAIVARVSTSARHDDVAVDGSDERIKRFFFRIYEPHLSAQPNSLHDLVETFVE